MDGSPQGTVGAVSSEVRLGSFEATDDVRLYGGITKEELRGVGSTSPYIHDGRSATLTEAILEHGGGARRSRAAFVRLSEQEQMELISFLSSLVLLKLEQPSPVVWRRLSDPLKYRHGISRGG